MSNERHDLPPIILLPEGPHRCGDVVTAQWTLTNFGDADASGGRLAFELHPALNLISGEGAATIPDLAPGDSITSELAFSIGQARSGDAVYLRASVTWPDGATLLSPRTDVSLAIAPRISVEQPLVQLDEAGTKAVLSVRISNGGGAVDPSVVTSVPVPAGLNPRGDVLTNGCVERKLSIGAYATETVAFEFDITDEFLADYLEFDGMRVECVSSGCFYLQPPAIGLSAQARLSGSRFSIDGGPHVVAGSEVEVAVEIENSGRSSVKRALLAIELPKEFIFAPGSVRVNDYAESAETHPHAVSVPVIRPGQTCHVRFRGHVVTPSSHGAEFLLKGRVGDCEIEPYRCIISSEAAFPLSENYAWLDGSPNVEPSGERLLRIQIANRGSDVSQPLRIRIVAPQLIVEDATLHIGEEARALKIVPILRNGKVPGSAIDIGTMGPLEEQTVVVRIVAPESFDNGADLPLECFLRESGRAEITVGRLSFIGRSFPRISDESSISIVRTDPLRLGQGRTLAVVLKNAGADVARDVYLDLDLPPGLQVERIHGATLADGRVLFKEIAPGANAEATVALQVVSIAAGKSVVRLRPLVFGKGITCVHLPPLELSSDSQSFLDEFHVESVPSQDGSVLEVRLNFRNIGDGSATRVRVFGRTLDSYSPSTTSINGRTYRDIRGCSPLAFGFSMPPIAPGESVEIAYTVRLEADELFTPLFRVESEDQDATEARGPSYQARLRHRFLPELLASGEPAVGLAQLTSVDEAEIREHTEVSPTVAVAFEPDGDEVVVEPQQSAEIEVPEPVEPESADTKEADVVTLPFGEASPLRFVRPSAPAQPAVAQSARDAQMERMSSGIDLLFQREIGLYRHVLAMRFFAPDRIPNASWDVDEAWGTIGLYLAEDLRTPLMRLVMPDFEPTLEWSKMLDHDNALPSVGVLMRDMPELMAGYFEPDEPPTIHHLNALLPELIGRYSSNGASDQALSSYNDALAQNFKALVYMGEAQRHERMLKAPTEELDEALRRVHESMSTAVAV